METGTLEAQETKAQGTQTYHCDMYYHDCTKRLKADPFDVRVDKDGFVLPGRMLCLDGSYPGTKQKPCPHCIEWKALYRYFNKKPRKNSLVRKFKIVKETNKSYTAVARGGEKLTVSKKADHGLGQA